jgi:hypothetical protein
VLAEGQRWWEGKPEGRAGNGRAEQKAGQRAGKSRRHGRTGQANAEGKAGLRIELAKGRAGIGSGR